ncbi:MAG: lipopolysaccharide heptosyltransferase II [Desulfobacca sp.]|nr:lipopolysaccharide heptosyltransferase II [Desulfobacca sp.]
MISAGSVLTPPPFPLERIRRIALIQPSRIGDIVFSLPTLSGLRQLFPEARISWLVDERCKDLVADHPDLDESIIIPFKSLEKAIKNREWSRVRKTLSLLRKELRERSFDLSVDLHGLAKSALLVFLAKASFRIGSANTTGMKELSGLFSKEIPPQPKDLHTIERNLTVISYLGGWVEQPQFKFTIPSAQKEEIQTLLEQFGCRERDRLIVIHPGAGWLSRRWPVTRYADLIHKLQKELSARLIIIGGAEGGSKEDLLFKELFSLIQVPVINLVQQLSLKQLLALLERIDLFVGNEAGPMHLATALNKPVVAVIGPTRPELTGPFGPKARIVRKEVGCNPCRERNCPDLKCMKAIEVSDVFNAIQSAW